MTLGKALVLMTASPGRRNGEVDPTNPGEGGRHGAERHEWRRERFGMCGNGALFHKGGHKVCGREKDCPLKPPPSIPCRIYMSRFGWGRGFGGGKKVWGAS